MQFIFLCPELILTFYIISVEVSLRYLNENEINGTTRVLQWKQDNKWEMPVNAQELVCFGHDIVKVIIFSFSRNT